MTDAKRLEFYRRLTIVLTAKPWYKKAVKLYKKLLNR